LEITDLKTTVRSTLGQCVVVVMVALLALTAKLILVFKDRPPNQARCFGARMGRR
jgi:hypothetical protein